MNKRSSHWTLIIPGRWWRPWFDSVIWIHCALSLPLSLSATWLQLTVLLGRISWHCIAWSSSETSGLQLPVSTADTVCGPLYLQKVGNIRVSGQEIQSVKDIIIWLSTFKRCLLQHFAFSFWFGSHLYVKKPHISLTFTRHGWKFSSDCHNFRNRQHFSCHKY